MDSTDNKTFIKKLKELEKRTKSFTEINPTILKEDTRNLMIFRVILGITINQLSKKLRLPYSWLYHLEHSNKKIKDDTAESYSLRIYKLLKENNLVGNVNLENTILNLQSLKGIRKETRINIMLKDLKNKDFKEFMKLVNEVKKRTNNFSHFPSSLILEESKVILIIRILLGLSQKEFAKKTGMANMTVEELENGYRKIRWPVTSRIYADKLERLILDNKIVIEEPLIKKRWEKWKNTRKIKEKKTTNWKTIRKMTIADFKNYFYFIKKQTNNLKEININLFQKSPQLIVIFRILFNLTQRDLDRKLKLKGRVISDYERGTYKTISRGRAELLKNFFESQIKEQNLSKITIEEAIERFISVKEAMYTHSRYSPEFLKSWTNQEKKVFKELQSLRVKDLTIDAHKTIETPKGRINVDFLINYKKKPKIIIESTKFHHTKSRKFNYNFKTKIFNLDYRFIKVRKRFPEIFTILIVEVDRDRILERRIKRFVEEETIAINKTFINSYKTALKETIKGIIQEER